MNLLFLSVVAFVALFVLVGYRRGFFKSAAGIVGVILSIILTVLISPVVSTILCDYTTMDEAIESGIRSKVVVEETTALTTNQVSAHIEALEVPDVVKNRLYERCNPEDIAAAGVKTATDYVVKSLVDMAMRGIAYVITALVVMLIVKLILTIMNVASYIPIVKGIDKCGGMLFAAGEAMIILWLLMAIVTLLAIYPWAQMTLDMINENAILKWMYESSLFVKLICLAMG